MHDRLGSILGAALDHLSTGVVIMTGDCAMLHANSTAAEMIEHGWPIRTVNNIVQGRERHVTEALVNGAKHISAECHRLNADIRFDICLSCSSGRKEAVLGSLKVVSPGAGEDQKDTIISLYLTTRPPNANAPLACIASTFGLTAAETRILGALEIYGAVPAVAVALALSENTVKTHLQSIFTKTGTARQTQLLRMVSGLRPPLRERKGYAAEFEASLGKRKKRKAPAALLIAPKVENSLTYA